MLPICCGGRHALVSFEHPWSGLALLLFLPFLLWLRRQQPPLHAVGGLEPFRRLPVIGEGRRHRRPWSFWMLLAAYLCGTVALAGPRSGALPRLLLEDRSRSMEEAVSQAPTGFEEIRVLGGQGEVVTVFQIMEALLQVQGERQVTVWTDQPPPASLPDNIHWLWDPNSRLDQVQGKILHAVPVEAGQWRVHWALRPGQKAVLQVGTWSSPLLTGDSGTTLVEVEALPAKLLLRDPDAGEVSESLLDSTDLPEFAFLLSPDVHVAWEAALLAIWPDAALRRVTAVQPGGFVMVVKDAQRVEAPPSWASFPWEVEPTAQEVASLAATWRSWLVEKGDGPLDRREWLLPSARPVWDSGILGFAQETEPARTPDWALWLLWIGGLSATAGWWSLPRPGKGSS